VTHDVDEAVYLGDRVIVLAGSPATVERELEIDLPRPRDQLQTRELPHFLALRHEVYQTLASRGSTAEEQAPSDEETA
jgi:NitT/TauT family transport system ATP-binding protein